MEPAPFFADLAEGPAGGHSVWLDTDDGVRIRMVVWPDGRNGTVFIHPGRTEFAEKYGRVAADLAARGYASLAIDWRGQGLADRVAEDPNLGHVEVFSDYQHDANAVLDAVRKLGLPEPYFLIGHSMGGAIGLGAMISGQPFDAAVFSAPMWGIQMTAALRPVAWALPRVARAIGRGEHYAPGAQKENYVATSPFEDNSLTTDPDQYAYMKRQVLHDSRLALGGPSLHWLHEALEETRALRSHSLPKVPTLAAVGSEETVVDPVAIAALANRWPECRMEVYPGARHELMMERPEVRDAVIGAACDLFDSHRSAAA